jgi:hypothetical protein
MLKYLATALVLYGLFIGSQFLLEYLSELNKVTYQWGRTIYVLMILTSMLIGVILGIENLGRTPSNEKCSWKLNWQRFLILGLPALIIVLNFTLSLFGIPSLLFKFSMWYIFIKTEFIMMISLILGYILGSSFYRDESSH